MSKDDRLHAWSPHYPMPLFHANAHTKSLIFVDDSQRGILINSMSKFHFSIAFWMEFQGTHRKSSVKFRFKRNIRWMQCCIILFIKIEVKKKKNLENKEGMLVCCLYSKKCRNKYEFTCQSFCKKPDFVTISEELECWQKFHQWNCVLCNNESKL